MLEGPVQTGSKEKRSMGRFVVTLFINLCAEYDIMRETLGLEVHKFRIKTAGRNIWNSLDIQMTSPLVAVREPKMSERESMLIKLNIQKTKTGRMVPLRL